MTASADLVVNIVTKVSGNGMKDATDQTSKFRRGLGAASKVAGAALLGIAAAGISAAKAAAEDAQGQALLANSMKNAAGASKEQIAATEDWITAQSKATGVADDELRPALGTLVRATGDVTKSQKALKTAMDISAATGKPLKSITDAMAKGFGGNTSALSRLVPGISQAALKSKDFGRIMGEVAQKTKGAAAAAANTAAGKMKRFSNAMAETKESIGGALLPAFDKLATVLMVVAQWAQDHGTLFAIIAGGVAVLATAIIALNVALSIYNTITAVTAVVSGAAWAATLGPILLVVAAVLLVVGAVILLWKKSKTFRTVVLAVWSAIKTGAQQVARFVVNVWQAITAGARKMSAVIRSIWQGIRAAAAAVATAVRTAWQRSWSAITAYVRLYLTVLRIVFSAIRTAVGAIVSWIRDRWRDMWSGVSELARAFQTKLAAVWSAIRAGASGVTKPFTLIASAIQHVIDLVGQLISALGRIHVPKISLPHIPGTRSVAAVPSGVTPFGAPAVPTASARGVSSSAVAAAGGGPVIIVNGALDPEAVARQVGRILSGHNRRVGLRVAG